MSWTILTNTKEKKLVGSELEKNNLTVYDLMGELLVFRYFALKLGFWSCVAGI